MIKIYGLYEKYSFYGWGVIPVKVKEKHPDLWGIAKKLKNSKIGIELAENFQQKHENADIRWITPRIYTELYRKLNGKNTIYFLENQEIFDNLSGILLNQVNNKKDTPNLERFKSKINYDYSYKVERSKRIIEQIEKQNPDFSFMGNAHACYIHKNYNLNDIFMEVPQNLDIIMDEINFAFKSASSDEELKINLKNIPSLSYSFFNAKDLPSEAAKEYEYTISEMQGIERLFNIINRGQVSERNREPDFIGTWSLDKSSMPLLGFFEMYAANKDGDKINGIVRDALGDAEFHGVLKNDGINFTKTYTNRFEAFHPLSGEIIYSACKINGFYRGTFESREQRGRTKYFMLFKYSPCLEQKIINSENEEQLLSKLS